VSSQLEQILSYLDKDGVSEIVIAVGRPIAMRQKGAYVNLTARPLTNAMLWAFVEGSELGPLIPHGDGSTKPTEISIGKRRVRVRTGRRGEEIVVRLERGSASTSQPADELALELDAPELALDSAVLPPDAPGVTFGKPGSKPFGPSMPTVAPLEGLELELDAPSFELEPAKPAAASKVTAPKGTFAYYVEMARAASASDLHISGNRLVLVRINNALVPVEPGAAPLTAEQSEALLLPLLDETDTQRLRAVGYVDLAIDAPGGGRLRANISRHQVGYKGTFRLAFDRPRTIEELGLPKDIAKVVQHHQGFVVIAGPSGHGKTSTLAALVDLVNGSRAHHILTVEDPIEIEHPRKLAVVSQREAGKHTKSFAAALKASLREDPDVIVIGELRDRETVEIALTAAETGHLVIATMSTPSAAKTLDRLIDMFPPEDHSQVRASIAGALRAVVAQRLVPAIGGGVVPAIELVTGVLPLAVLIRDDKLYQLPNLMQRGRAFGMIRFDESLAELVRTGKITEDTAMEHAEAKNQMAGQIKGPAPAPTPSATGGVKGRLGALFGGKKDGDA
jgi:twitching motility protein PilT